MWHGFLSSKQLKLLLRGNSRVCENLSRDTVVTKILVMKILVMNVPSFSSMRLCELLSTMWHDFLSSRLQELLPRVCKNWKERTQFVNSSSLNIPSSQVYFHRMNLFICRELSQRSRLFRFSVQRCSNDQFGAGETCNQIKIIILVDWLIKLYVYWEKHWKY